MRFYNEGNKCNCGKRSCPECNPKVSKISKPDANGLVNKKTIGNHYMKFDEAFMQGYYDALNEMEEYDEYEEEDAYESYNEEDLENAYLEGYYAALNETSAATKAKQRSNPLTSKNYGPKGGNPDHTRDQKLNNLRFSNKHSFDLDYLPNVTTKKGNIGIRLKGRNQSNSYTDRHTGKLVPEVTSEYNKYSIARPSNPNHVPSISAESTYYKNHKNNRFAQPECGTKNGYTYKRSTDN